MKYSMMKDSHFVDHVKEKVKELNELLSDAARRNMQVEVNTLNIHTINRPCSTVKLDLKLMKAL